MEGLTVILFVVIFLIVLFFLLKPGVILHLDSNQRYDQMLKNINENHEVGFITQQERLILINDLSPNAVRIFFVRRKLQKFVKSRNNEYAQKININNTSSQNETNSSLEADSIDRISQKIDGDENIQMNSGNDALAAIGQDSTVVGGDVLIGVSSEKHAEILAENILLKENHANTDVDIFLKEFETSLVASLEKQAAELQDENHKRQEIYHKKQLSEISEKVKESRKKADKMLERYQKEIVRLNQKIKFDLENGLKPHFFDIENLHKKHRLLQFLEQEIEKTYGSLDDSD